MCKKLDISDTYSSIELCDLGLRLYIRALEVGYLPVGEATTCLCELGLVRESDEATLVSVRPSTAAQLTVNPLRRQSMDLRVLISHLDATFASAETAQDAAHRSTTPRLVAITGSETISVVLQEAVRGCRTELLIAQPGGRQPSELLERALEEVLPALRHGARQRMIYQHTVRTHQPTMEYVQSITSAGAEVRTLDEVIDWFVICDRHTAYIPTNDSDSGGALEVRDPAVIRFLAGVFENSWSRARPICEPTMQANPPAITNEIQLAIARMLVRGHVYSRIAHTLGMSERTVAAYVGRMSDTLGSGSPAQLGYLIAATGLLDRD